MAVSAVFSADFSDFQNAVQKAEVSLKSFETGAGKVESSLTRMANSLSGTKLIQDATLAAEAVERIGGVSKLTEAELQKLSAQAKDAVAKLQAMGQNVPEGIQKIADAGKKTSDVFSDLTTQVKATALGFLSAQAILGTLQGAFRGLVSFLDSSIDSYASAEAAAKKMTVALESQGNATPETVAAFNDLATSFQKTTVYSDDLINEMEALLTQVGDIAPAQMKDALTASTNLASGLGIDLREATMLVSKAFASGGEELGRLKSVLGDAYRPGMDMAAVLDVINSKFGGQAAAEAETYAGKIKQIANEWDNVKEAVGGAIAQDPVVIAGLRATKEAATATAEGGNAITTSFKAMGATQPLWLQSLAKNLYESAAAANKLAEDMKPLEALSAPKQFSGFGFSPELKARIKDVKKEADDFFDSTIAGWKKEDQAATAFTDKLAAAFKKWSGGDVAEQAKVLDITFRRMADSGKITAQQVNEMAAEAAKLAQQGAILSPRLWAIVEATGALYPPLVNGTKGMTEFGTAVDLQIPKLSAFNAAMVDLNSKIGAADASLTAFTSAGIKLPALTLPKVPKGMFESLFGTPEQMGAYVSNSIIQAVQGGGNAFAAAAGTIGQQLGTNIAKTLSKSLVDEGSGMFSKALGGLLSSALPVVGSLIGPLASALWGKLFGSAGRDLVKDFAASMGGFDALREQLNVLGAEGERLWKNLTQGVGKNNPAEAKAAIEAITAALEAQKTKTNEAAEAAAREAEAQVKANQEALDAITEKYAGTISKLESEWKSLSDSVAQEAEEDAMGVVETQQRERMKQIEAEKKAQEAMRDAEIAAKKSTFDTWVEDGKQTWDELQRVFGKTLKIPYEFVPKNGPDGGGATYAPTGGARPGGGGSVTMPIYIDGQVLTTAVIKRMPTVLRQRGLVG